VETRGVSPDCARLQEAASRRSEVGMKEEIGNVQEIDRERIMVEACPMHAVIKVISRRRPN
jgi:adenylate kinase